MADLQKTAAQTLFNCGFSQKEISEIFDKSEGTISGWATEGKWKKRRSDMQLLLEKSQEAVQELISFQTELLVRIARKRKEALDDKGEDMDMAELKAMLLSNKDLDGLQKLYTTIKSKDLKWEDYIRIAKEIMVYLSGKPGIDVDLIQRLLKEFIKERQPEA